MKVKSNKNKTGALKLGVLKRIKDDQGVILLLINSTGKSYPTIKRWLENNSIQLTQASALSVICKELGLTQEQVLN